MSTNPAEASWTSLPFDLLALFFSFLTPAECLRAAAVCRAWQRAAIAPRIWLPHLAALLSLPAESLSRAKGGKLGDVAVHEAYIIARPLVSGDVWPESSKAAFEFLRDGWARDKSALDFLHELPTLPMHPLRECRPGGGNVLRFLWMALTRRGGVGLVASMCIVNARCVRTCSGLHTRAHTYTYARISP